jgi:hypothetical protein
VEVRILSSAPSLEWARFSGPICFLSAESEQIANEDLDAQLGAENERLIQETLDRNDSPCPKLLMWLGADERDAFIKPSVITTRGYVDVANPPEQH